MPPNNLMTEQIPALNVLQIVKLAMISLVFALNALIRIPTTTPLPIHARVLHLSIWTQLLSV